MIYFIFIHNCAYASLPINILSIYLFTNISYSIAIVLSIKKRYITRQEAVDLFLQLCME